MKERNLARVICRSQVGKQSNFNQILDQVINSLYRETVILFFYLIYFALLIWIKILVKNLKQIHVQVHIEGAIQHNAGKKTTIHVVPKLDQDSHYAEKKSKIKNRKTKKQKNQNQISKSQK